MTTGGINQGKVTVVRDPHRARPKADFRDLAMRVYHYAVRRTARSSQLSQFLVLLKYQMHRRESRRKRVAIRCRSGTSRWSAERDRGLTHCGDGPTRKGDFLFYPLFFVRRWLSYCGGGPIGKGFGLVSPLFLCSA